MKLDILDALEGNKRSHPSWVRGLKLLCLLHVHILGDVAPLVGAWIETSNQSKTTVCPARRTPRGCVD